MTWAERKSDIRRAEAVMFLTEETCQFRSAVRWGQAFATRPVAETVEARTEAVGRADSYPRERLGAGEINAAIWHCQEVLEYEEHLRAIEFFYRTYRLDLPEDLAAVWKAIANGRQP